MTARARITRAASAVLASALVAGAALMTSTGALAVELDEAPVSQVVELGEEAAPVAEDPAASESADATDTAAPAEAAPVSETTAEIVEDEAPETAAAEEAEDSAEGSVAEVPDEVSAAATDALDIDASGEVAEATLTWGVKSSFRNYIKGPIAGGTVVATGVTENNNGATFTWDGGAGTASTEGDAADVTFAGDNGVHFNGHHDILDFSLTNPHVVVTSATTADLYFDTDGREFVDTTTMGPEYSLEDVKIAEIVLPEPSFVDGVYTWTNAAATLAEAGVSIFGGFYDAGAEVDPVTFSTGVVETVEPGPTEPEEPTVTTTTVKANPPSISAGDQVTLTASVTPKDASGTVQFFDGKSKLDAAVAVEEGAASLKTTKLSEGTRSITAEFVPADQTQFVGSKSAAIEVTVKKKAATVQKLPVKAATLTWGVKSSFRNYIYNIQPKVFKGKSTLLGTTVQPKLNEGEFVWTGGTGTVTANPEDFRPTASDVSFGAGNGVHFQSHPMTVDGEEVWSLDLQFTNPRVVITSASTGELHMDVVGREFVDPTSVGEEYALNDVAMADLTLETPSVKNNVATWTDAKAVLTEEGSAAFGGFYGEGDELDPLTFSLIVDSEEDIVVGKRIATSTSLSASATTVDLGETITLKSTTKPGIDGNVTFRVPGAGITKSVKAKNGVATLAVSGLEARFYTATATFEPTDDAKYDYSVSKSLKLTVNDPAKSNESPAGNASGSGQTAGSLSWGISSFFVAYTTEKSGSSACPTAGGHCANGEIVTSGVGAGWLFPQAAGSSWDVASQTGTVQYSGVVSFNGYGQTMFQVANPSITVTSPTSATLNTGYSGGYGPSSVGLDLGSASKSVGANGEVTWSGVAVQGGLSGIRAGQSSNFDSLSFTVGAASGVSYGATSAGTDKKTYSAADTAPATTGVTILTDDEKITAGSRLELEAPGFDPDDEGVFVVLYDGNGRNPVVLDEEASANSNGTVTWAGTLPKEISNEHIITVQGSIDAGAVVDVLKKKTSTKKATTADALRAPAADQTKAAGILGPDAIAAGGMATWEWWASAGGLVAIAGCMTLLVIRQRKLAE